jgi:acetyl-CoA C-acetyltransferase
MAQNGKALSANWNDVWLIDGVRTPFADYTGALSQVSPIDLGIKVAREAFAKTKLSPEDVGIVVTGNMAQASFDAYRSKCRRIWYSGCAEPASK